MSASEEQILEALPMVRRMASRYRGTPLGAEDALGVGAVALVEASRRYDPSHGVPFFGFAFRRVRGALRDAYRAQPGARGGRPAAEALCDPEVLDEVVGDVRLGRPDGRLDLLAAVSRLRCRLRTIVVLHACGVPHTRIARDLGVSEPRVSQLLRIARGQIRAEMSLRLDRA